MMTMSYVYLTPPLIIFSSHKTLNVGYQNFICHLLNLLALALDVILQFSLSALNNLQPFHLVL